MRGVRRRLVAALPTDPAHQADRQVTKRGDENDRQRLRHQNGGSDDEQREHGQGRQRAMREKPLGQIIGQQRIFGYAGWARRMHNWEWIGVGNHRIGRRRRNPNLWDDSPWSE